MTTVSATTTGGKDETLPSSLAVKPDGKLARVHVAFLDGLRALAALYVAFSHVLAEYQYANQSLWPKAIKIFSFGHVAVDVFIVLSGFCLTIPLARNGMVLKSGALDFYRRRAWRILPTYYAALLLSLALIATWLHEPTVTSWQSCVPATPKAIGLHLLLLHDLSADSVLKIVNPMWSIAVEWRIYFLFPLFVWLLRKYDWTVTIAASSLMSLLYSYFLVHFTDADLAFACPHYILLFTIGVVCSMYVQKSNARCANNNVFYFGILATITVLKLASHFMKLHLGSFVLYATQDVIVALLAAGIISYCAMNLHSPITRLFALRPLATVGTFAYSIYLIHYPLLQCEWLTFRSLGIGDRLGLYLMFVVGVPAIVGIAYGFYSAFEKPFLTKRSIEAWLPMRKVSAN